MGFTIKKTLKTPGYSGILLAKKLGIKENFKIKLINQPEYYFKLFSDMPIGIKNINDNKTKKDFIHYFAIKADVLSRDMKYLKGELEQNGIIWISWYKKSAKMVTDVTENIIRDIALKNGLVDIKVCAIDEHWSGLKLVIPLKARRS